MFPTSRKKILHGVSTVGISVALLTGCNTPASNAFEPVEETFEEFRASTLSSSESFLDRQESVVPVDCGTVAFGAPASDVNACLANAWQSRISAYGIVLIENNSAFSMSISRREGEPYLGVFRFGSREDDMDQSVRLRYTSFCADPEVSPSLDELAFTCDSGNGTRIPLDFDHPGLR